MKKYVFWMRASSTGSETKGCAAAVRFLAFIASGVLISSQAIAEAQTSTADAAEISKLNEQALMLKSAGKQKDAILIYLHLLKLAPNDNIVYNNLGVMYLDLKDYKNAWKAFNTSIKLDKNFSAAWVNLASCYAATGNTAHAVALLRDVRKRFPNEPETQKAVTKALSNFSTGKEAQASSTSMIKDNPNDFNNWLRLALSYCKTKDYRKAVSTLDAGKSRFNSKPEYHYNLAYCLQEGHEYKRAAEEYLTAARLKNDEKEWIKHAMYCQLQGGDLDGLQATRKMFLAKYPNDDYSKNLGPAIAYADKDIEKTRKRESSGAVTDSKTRYRKSDLPLKVFIHERVKGQSFWTSKGFNQDGIDYAGEIQKALQAWSGASGNRLSFEVVNSPSIANIECRWTSDPSHLHYGFSAGETMYVTNVDNRPKATINLLTKSPSSKLTAEQFYAVCLHEIGHALGLSHSTKPEDAMFFTSSDAFMKNGLSSNDQYRVSQLYSNLP